MRKRKKRRNRDAPALNVDEWQLLLTVRSSGSVLGPDRDTARRPPPALCECVSVPSAEASADQDFSSGRGT